MKSRLLQVMTLALLSTMLVVFAPSTASASTNFALRLSHATPIVGEVNRISGSVTPATRPIDLQKYSSGRWVKVAATRSGYRGAYGFNVKATSTKAIYRAYAPRVRVTGKTYLSRYSVNVVVQGVAPQLYLGAPVSTVSGGALATTVATFVPARPGTVVKLFRRPFGSSVFSYAGSAKQGPTGVASFNVSHGTVVAPDTFKAVASTGSGAASASSAYATANTVAGNTFDDEFSGTALSTRWAFRAQDYTAQSAGRACSKPDAGMASVAGGLLTLHVKKIASSGSAIGRSCPYGVWQNAMIGTASASTPFSQSQGYFAARVKFQGAQGMHGSFWLQATGSGGTEIDTAEYFGNGRALGGLATFVHQGSLTNSANAGGENATVKQILGAGTPSSGWHVYSVQWDASGYLFRVDGIPVYRTSSLPSNTSGEMVLSLLTSDWELSRLQAPSSAMAVDWVRAYK